MANILKKIISTAFWGTTLSGMFIAGTGTWKMVKTTTEQAGIVNSAPAKNAASEELSAYNDSVTANNQQIVDNKTTILEGLGIAAAPTAISLAKTAADMGVEGAGAVAGAVAAALRKRNAAKPKTRG